MKSIHLPIAPLTLIWEKTCTTEWIVKTPLSNIFPKEKIYLHPKSVTRLPNLLLPTFTNSYTCRYTRCQVDVTHSGPGLFWNSNKRRVVVFGKLHASTHEKTFIFVALRSWEVTNLQCPKQKVKVNGLTTCHLKCDATNMKISSCVEACNLQKTTTLRLLLLQKGLDPSLWRLGLGNGQGL